MCVLHFVISGLGGIPQSLQGHATLSPQRLAAIPGYGHPALHNTTLSQFIDSMNSFSTAGVTPGAYKSIPVGQPAFSLPSHSEHSSVSRYSTVVSKESTISPPTSASVTEATRSWGLSNFVPPPAGPLGTLAPELLTGNTYSQIEPPPAHSGSVASRPSTIQRNPLQPSNHYSHGSSTHSSSRSDRDSQRTSQNRVPAHQNYSSSSSSRITTQPYQDNTRTSYSESSPLGDKGSYPNSPQLTSHQQNRSNSVQQNQFSSYTSASYNTSSNPVYTSNSQSDYHQSRPGDQTFNTSMSLQDLAEMSATQDKIPLEEHRPASLTHLGSSMSVSPVHQQSPMQPSPISVGSPQVRASSSATNYTPSLLSKILSKNSQNWP